MSEKLNQTLMYFILFLISILKAAFTYTIQNYAEMLGFAKKNNIFLKYTINFLLLFMFF